MIAMTSASYVLREAVSLGTYSRACHNNEQIRLVSTLGIVNCFDAQCGAFKKYSTVLSIDSSGGEEKERKGKRRKLWVGWGNTDLNRKHRVMHFATRLLVQDERFQTHRNFGSSSLVFGL